MLLVKTLFLSDAKWQETEVFAGDPDRDVFLSLAALDAQRPSMSQKKNCGKDSGHHSS